MPLLTLADAELAYGDVPLLDRASFAMEAGERIGLIGRNGTGKSSLLAVIAGTAALDDGELKRRDGLIVALVEQEPALPHAPTLRASLMLRAMPATHARFQDDRERWLFEARLAEFLHRFGVDESRAPGAASGGEVKRAALALASALEPELLLLDEPPNHLDIDGIALLESALIKQPSAIVVTHDRAFPANCYVQPSVITSSGKMEGIPVALMEAMMSGVPGVATSISGVPELVRPGETGWLVPPENAPALADALTEIYQNPAEAERRAGLGRQWVLKEFELSSNVRKLASLFTEYRPVYLG